jgi:hypothetical protein
MLIKIGTHFLGAWSGYYLESSKDECQLSMNNEHLSVVDNN